MPKKKLSFSDFMRVQFKGVLDAASGFLLRLGIVPNTMTLIGLAGNVVGSVLLGMGKITLGGWVLLLMGVFDVLDGSMARLQGKPTKFGGYLDSVVDRYSELFLFAGLLWYFMQTHNTLACSLAYVAAAGSVLVSYAKARAEGLGFDGKVGILTRFERYLVMVIGLIFNIPMIALWIIAIFANVTALQRIIYVRKQAKALGE